MPDSEYTASSRIRELCFARRIHHPNSDTWSIEARVLCAGTETVLWSFARQTASPSAIIRTLLRELPAYDDGRYDEQVLSCVKHICHQIEDDLDLGPALRSFHGRALE